MTRALGWPDDLRTGNAIYQPVEIGGADIDRLTTFLPGVAGVRLAEIFGVLGQQADKEADLAEVQPLLLSIPQLR